MKALLEGCVCLAAAIAGEFVGLGRDDDEVATCMFQELNQLDIRLLRRNIAVDQTEAQRQGRALGEVWLNEFWPFGGDGFGDFGVAISRQVGKIHLRLLALRAVRNGKEIDCPCASGRGGDLGLP